ncbi:MAG TPA: Gfo/Idh/MocA family oxidoreductase [Vicinamibacterales bacterium]|jgi:glucose-fructose oxidoreductase|nr:Gfo/Idh/MocA family oxidoreductase [Vicinamibacterales bacterium]
MAQSKVRYAVVGLGHIAQAAVLPSFAHARRNSSLHAIVSGSVEKLNEIGDKYRIPVRATYDDYERVLQEVDAVYICTPNSEHEDYVVRAAKAGKHVLCEKPLAVTQEECHRMIKAAKLADVRIMTAYRLHFEPLFLEVLDIVRSGRIGEPRFFSSSFSMHAKPGGIRTKRELGGGTLYDLGVYCINTARLMFGAEPSSVFGSSIDGARSDMPEIDEMTAGTLRFDGDRLATFTTSFNANGVSDFRVVGTEGNIHAEPAYEYAEALGYTLTVGDHIRKKKGRRRDQFAAEVSYFSDCVMNGKDPEPSAEEGCWDVRIVNALYQSAQTSKVVELNHFGPEDPPMRRQARDFPPVMREPELVAVEKPMTD